MQVITNLLTNAAKYTPPGGHIALTASASVGQAVVICEDNGPGIPMELVATLFDPFAQGPRTIDRGAGGLGLGLTLARAFTEMHAGTSLTSGSTSAAAGSCDVAAGGGRRTGGAGRAAVAGSRGARQRILLVDDNLDANEMLKSALEVAGHEVVTAVNGPDALAAASKVPPAVGVLDIGLPGMDGYELARRLRRLYPSVRLIALTGYGQTSDHDAALTAGFDAHCAKPVTISTLLGLIDEPVRVAAPLAAPGRRGTEVPRCERRWAGFVLLY